ncbi:MAG: hypothetical protein Q9160_004845, partial [Pyrenula sp. 1 TL-2023]
MELHPGPDLLVGNPMRTIPTSVEPCRERRRGGIVAGFEEPEPHVHVAADGKVARVLVDSLCRLADATVGDELQSGAGRGMLKD